MIEIPLGLRSRVGGSRGVDAWLVASNDPSVWLRTAAAWEGGLESIRFVPLRADAAASECKAVLITGDIVPARGVPRGTPYARLGAGLYIPTDADLFPPLDDHEIERLFPRDQVHIALPVAGVISAESESVLVAIDLLNVPPADGAAWNRAVTGIAQPLRLPPMRPAQQPSLEDVMSGGRDDIGRDADRLEELKALPRRPNGGRSGVGRVVTRGAAYGAMVVGAVAAGAIAKLAGALAGGGQHQSPGRAGAQSSSGGTASARGASWIDRLAHSLSQRVREISAALQERRDSEIDRLLHMLESDPDAGLRFAIPLGGYHASRGRAAPGGRLVEHGSDFRLPGQGAVGAADNWDLDHSKEMALRENYRTLANRELALGRYRRAAYIFSELIGDNAAAASALQTGRHFREAAVLYRDTLGRPLQAAECLEAGGLWAEAIDQYVSLKHYENAGDLHQKLGNCEDASSAYKLAMTEKCREQDFVEAARVCELKLKDADLALATLANGWPKSSQAEQCLRRRFAMLNSLARRDSIHGLLLELADESPSAPRLTSRELSAAANVIADLSNESTATFDRTIAVEATLRITSRVLSDASDENSKCVVDAIVSLEPTDQLLKRDGRRYLEGRSRAAFTMADISPQVPRRRRPQRSPVVIDGKWTLPRGIVWQSAAVIDEQLFVAGLHDEDPVVCRSTLEGEVEEPKAIVVRHSEGSETANETVVQLKASGTGQLLFHATQSLPSCTQHPWKTTSLHPVAPKVACPGQRSAIGVCASPGGGATTIECHPHANPVELVLNNYDANLTLQGSSTLADDVLRVAVVDLALVLPLPIAARGRERYFGVGRTLCRAIHNEVIETLIFDKPITQVSSIMRNTTLPIVVATSNSVSLVASMGDEPAQLTTSLRHPATALSPGGFVFATGEKLAGRGHEIQVYETLDGAYRGACELALLSDAWFCIPLPGGDKCLVIDRNGTVQRVAVT